MKILICTQKFLEYKHFCTILHTLLYIILIYNCLALYNKIYLFFYYSFFYYIWYYTIQIYKLSINQFCIYICYYFLFIPFYLLSSVIWCAMRGTGSFDIFFHIETIVSLLFSVVSFYGERWELPHYLYVRFFPTIYPESTGCPRWFVSEFNSSPQFR